MFPGESNSSCEKQRTSRRRESAQDTKPASPQDRDVSAHLPESGDSKEQPVFHGLVLDGSDLKMLLSSRYLNVVGTGDRARAECSDVSARLRVRACVCSGADKLRWQAVSLNTFIERFMEYLIRFLSFFFHSFFLFSFLLFCFFIKCAAV